MQIQLSYLLMAPWPERWLVLVTIPIAVHGYCVESATRTRVSVEGHPSHSRVGFRAEPLPVCSKERVLLSGVLGGNAAMLASPFCFALSGSTSLHNYTRLSADQADRRLL